MQMTRNSQERRENKPKNYPILGKHNCTGSPIHRLQIAPKSGSLWSGTQLVIHLKREIATALILNEGLHVVAPKSVFYFGFHSIIL